MYWTKGQHFYWPHMANADYSKFDRSLSTTRNLQTNKNQKNRPVVYTEDPISFVSVDVLHTLPKLGGKNRYIVIITNWYLNMTKDKQIARTTATKFFDIFLETMDGQLVKPVHNVEAERPTYHIYVIYRFFQRIRYYIDIDYRALLSGQRPGQTLQCEYYYKA